MEQIELFYKQINWAKQIELLFKQTKKQKKECEMFIFDPLVKSLNLKMEMLH